MRDYFSLDLNHLDEEWVVQPKWFSQVAHQLVEAREAHEVAKAATELVWAELDLEIRADPQKFGLEKITEALAKSAITVQKRYQEAVKKEIAAKRAVGDLEADRDTLEHRKKALEKSVDLRLSDYWSEPRMSSKAQQASSEKEQLEGFKKKKPKATVYVSGIYQGEVFSGISGPTEALGTLVADDGVDKQVIVAHYPDGSELILYKWDVIGGRWTSKDKKKKRD